jgi:hypothetical protein
MTTGWYEFDAYCSQHGLDAIELPPDRAANLFLFTIRSNADEARLSEIDEALTPPRSLKFGGVPAWYGSDEDAWAEFSRQAPKRRE